MRNTKSSGRVFTFNKILTNGFLVFPGNGGVDILLFPSQNDEEDSGLDRTCTRLDDEEEAESRVTEAAGLCFLDDGLDWTGVRGERNDEQVENT